ncbi:hypothetical protein BDV98DRAFT_587341, partial [Pterulicium gracile]
HIPTAQLVPSISSDDRISAQRYRYCVRAVDEQRIQKLLNLWQSPCQPAILLKKLHYSFFVHPEAQGETSEGMKSLVFVLEALLLDTARTPAVPGYLFVDIDFQARFLEWTDPSSRRQTQSSGYKCRNLTIIHLTEVEHGPLLQILHHADAESRRATFMSMTRRAGIGGALTTSRGAPLQQRLTQHTLSCQNFILWFCISTYENLRWNEF